MDAPLNSSGCLVGVVTKRFALERMNNSLCRRFWANSTRHYSLYGSYYPRKSEFATGLVFERTSGCLKKHSGGSSLLRIYGILDHVPPSSSSFCPRTVAEFLRAISDCTLRLQDIYSPPPYILAYLQVVAPEMAQGRG